MGVDRRDKRDKRDETVFSRGVEPSSEPISKRVGSAEDE
jgi:hypothetical protein